MEQILIEYAICKWEDRASAQYFPLNNIYEHTCENGCTNRTIFDAYGRSMGEPNFGYPRPATEEEINGDMKYYRFDTDSVNKIVVYRKTGGVANNGGVTEIISNDSNIVLQPGTIMVLTDPIELMTLSYTHVDGDNRECGVIFTTGDSFDITIGGFIMWDSTKDNLRFEVCDSVEPNKHYVLSIQNKILLIKEVNEITPAE